MEQYQRSFGQLQLPCDLTAFVEHPKTQQLTCNVRSRGDAIDGLNDIQSCDLTAQQRTRTLSLGR